jgi:DNA-binding Lrp family transcriptional regulator
MNPDDTDRALLQLLQDEFPLVSDPWKNLGARLGISDNEVLHRVQALRASGVLRGICPILESEKAGIGASTLVAMQVPSGRIDEIAEIISAYPQVSHNYLREHRYNLWFTLGARDREELDLILGEIRTLCGLDGSDMIELPARRRFKIDVRFPVVPRQDLS